MQHSKIITNVFSVTRFALSAVANACLRIVRNEVSSFVGTALYVAPEVPFNMRTCRHIIDNLSVQIRLIHRWCFHPSIHRTLICAWVGGIRCQRVRSKGSFVVFLLVSVSSRFKLQIIDFSPGRWWRICVVSAWMRCVYILVQMSYFTCWYDFT